MKIWLVRHEKGFDVEVVKAFFDEADAHEEMLKLHSETDPNDEWDIYTYKAIDVQ